tara:strand:+ start:525 stop:683 length:159 start_codon:yes stop_codon:yes gene_type:complete
MFAEKTENAKKLDPKRQQFSMAQWAGIFIFLAAEKQLFFGGGRGITSKLASQ